MCAIPVATFFLTFFFWGFPLTGAPPGGGTLAVLPAVDMANPSIPTQLITARRPAYERARASPCADPCAYARWCACAARGPAAPCGDGGRGSSRGPSGA